jgi:hypothetical protein
VAGAALPRPVPRVANELAKKGVSVDENAFDSVDQGRTYNFDADGGLL